VPRYCRARVFLFILFFWGGVERLGRTGEGGCGIDSKYMNQIEVPQQKEKKEERERRDIFPNEF